MNYIEAYNKAKKRYLDEGGTVDKTKENSETTTALLNEVEKLAYVEPTENKVNLDELFKRIEEDTTSTQDVEDEVKSIIEAKYGTTKSEKEKTANTKIENLNEQKTQNDILKEQKNANINKIYNNYVNNAENQALKRGLARSSIILNQLDGIEKERAEQLLNNANTYADELASLEKEIEDTYSNLQSDLALLELDKASEEKTLLSEKLNALEKKKKEITEFNNNVEKLKIDYKIKLDNAEKNNANTQNEQEEQAKKQAFNNQYNLIYNTLKALGKQQALSELFSNEKYAEYLGDKINDMYYALKYSKY